MYGVHVRSRHAVRERSLDGDRVHTLARRRTAIARRLRTARRRAGVTIAEAACRAGVSRYTWLRWESGWSSIPLERVRDLSRAVALTLGG